MAETIRELHRRWKRLNSDWRVSKNDEYQAAFRALSARAKELREALPVRSTVCQAPRAAHILLLEPLAVGVLRRRTDAFLCGASRPQGPTHGTLDPATCLKCLELAERLAKREADAP
jgi:hypothetical protein